MNQKPWYDDKPIACEVSATVRSAKPTLDPICQEDSAKLDESIGRYAEALRDAKRALKYLRKIRQQSKRVYRDYALLKAVSKLDDNTLFYALREGIVVVKSPCRLECLAEVGNLNEETM